MFRFRNGVAAGPGIGHRFAPILAAAAITALFGGVAGSRRIQADEKRTESVTTLEEKSRAAIEALVKDLGSEDYAVRESATESLVALGPEARTALEKALSSEDPEVKARAARCLREIDGGPEPDSEEDAPAPPDSRGRGTFRLQRGGRSADRLPVEAEELIERLREDLLRSQGDPLGFRFELKPGASVSAAVNVQVTHDGRTWSYSESPENGIEVRITAPGEPEQVIRATTREELLKAHPELEERFGLGEIDGLVPSLPLLGPSAPFARDPFGQRGGRSRAGGDRLGLAVEPVDAALAKRLSLGGEIGVVVLEVEGESAADRAGLEPDDVILSLNGTPTNEAAAIRRATRGLKRGDPLRFEIVRGGEVRTIEGRY